MNPEVPLGEPQEPKQPVEPQIEVAVEDDTPEQDRGRKPAPPQEHAVADDEAEDGRFAPEVQQRIKRLRYVYHDERRSREKAEREAQEAIRMLQQAFDENTRLKGQLSTGERVLIDQAQRRAAAQVESAKHMLRIAQDSTDTNQLLQAQEAFARAIAEHDRVQQYMPQLPEAQAPPRQQLPPQPQQQPAAPPDERFTKWINKNPWFRQPGYEAMSGFAMGVHDYLWNRGIRPQGDTVDQYWSTIDRELQERFPAFFGSGAENGNGHPSNGQQRVRATPKPVVASAGVRAPGGPVKVKLTQSQADIARKLGLTNEQYARQLLKEQGEQVTRE